jgi:integrase/recombinase XerD
MIPFDEWLVSRGLAARSITEYTKWVRRAERWCWTQRLDLPTLTPSQVRQFAQTTPDSWSSRKQVRAALGHYYTYVGRTDTPHEAVPVPRKPGMTTRALTADDAHRLRDAAVLVGGRRGLATLCGLYLAARRSEIAGLTWDGWSDSQFRFQRTKSHDWHTVPVHPVLAEQLAANRPDAWGPWLFPGYGRPHVCPGTVWSWIRQVGDLAGVRVTPHQLRHTALTTALEHTRDLRAVMELAGHRDPSVTAGYTRLSEQRLAAAVDALDY